MKITGEELKEAHKPIISLISKSEKAQQKLAPDSWQYKMLRDNLHALYVASALMEEDSGRRAKFSVKQLKAALESLAAMIKRTKKTKAVFSPGTSQHTLQRNRLKALRIAMALITAVPARRRPQIKKTRKS